MITFDKEKSSAIGKQRCWFLDTVFCQSINDYLFISTFKSNNLNAFHPDSMRRKKQKAHSKVGRGPDKIMHKHKSCEIF